MTEKEKTELRIECDNEYKARLKEIAKKERRTLTGQVLYFLDKAIKDYDSLGD